MSPTRMMKAIRETYTFPDMGRKVDEWCKHCQCTKAKAALHPRTGMTQSRPLYGLYQYVVLDIVGPFPQSRRKNKYWLTIMCAYSKDLELVPLKSKEATEVAKALLIHWVCRRGAPLAILSDNAKELTGKVATHLCEALEIRSDLIAAYHHESAGLVERVHRFAHQIMQSANGCSPSVTTWDEQLPYIRFAIFSAEISKTKKSSFEICYGKKPTLPGDLLAGGISLPKSLKDQYAIAQAAMEATRDYFLIQRKKTKVADRLARDEGQRRIKRIYEAGEAVYVSKPSFTRLAGVRGLRKLLTGFRGPYEVARIDTHNNVYVLIDGEEEKFNVDRVSRVSTLEPIERRPPSYPTGRLTYTAERAKRRVDTPEPRASRHRPIDRPAASGGAKEARTEAPTRGRC